MEKKKNIARLNKTGIVAIIRGIERHHLIETVKALHGGGVECVEVTFNTPGAAEMIKHIKESFQGKIFVGAGTVTDEKTAKVALEAGAEFILSPSLHREVIECTNQYGAISIPGVFTPTEMVLAHQWGADIVKIFPAGLLGPEYIKQVRGPLDNIEIMAVGGIDLNNTAAFIQAGSMGVGIGNALVNKKLIQAGRYEEITELAKQFIEEVKRVK